MARRKLTPAEEDALVRDIEAHKDDESRWDYAHPKRNVADFKGDVPLRLTLGSKQFDKLMKIAQQRGVSTTQVASEALDDFLKANS